MDDDGTIETCRAPQLLRKEKVAVPFDPASSGELMLQRDEDTAQITSETRRRKKRRWLVPVRSSRWRRRPRAGGGRAVRRGGGVEGSASRHCSGFEGSAGSRGARRRCGRLPRPWRRAAVLEVVGVSDILEKTAGEPGRKHGFFSFLPAPAT